jgi:hypothetical protein
MLGTNEMDLYEIKGLPFAQEEQIEPYEDGKNIMEEVAIF